MIDSLSVENFRCFENLEVHGLRRINVLVGRNSSGKTTLLESIFLAAGGSPEIVLRMRSWRGMADGSLQLGIGRKSYEGLWKDLFYGFDQDRIISVSLIGSPNSTRSVRVFYSRQDTLTIPLGDNSSDPAAVIPINFEWKDSAGHQFPAQPRITGDGLSSAMHPGLPISFFTSTLKPSPAENASRYSDLSKENKEGIISEALREEFPFVQSLSIEISAGIPLVYAVVSGVREKIPLALVSSGVNKFLSLLLAMASSSLSGAVLIDELDNGFYYDRLQNVWSDLLSFSRRFDCQVFASTHSLECLKSVLPSLRGNEDDFCVIRMERLRSTSTAHVFAGKDFQSAILEGVDVR